MNAAPSDPTLRNVRAVGQLERHASRRRSPLERFTDIVTQTAGSGTFIVIHIVWFAVWIILNRDAYAFDAYPYNLLNLVVALEAIVLTSIVLMTQNRMTAQADKRAHLDLQVNLLAEQELTAILRMVAALCQKAGIPAHPTDSRIESLLKETDIGKLAVALDQELAETPTPAK